MNTNTNRSPEDRLADLGISLPTPAAPVAAYVPSRLVPAGAGQSLLVISGQIPLREGKLIATGSVPSNVSLETARECARQCVLNGLAAARSAVGSLDRIASVIRVGCFVSCDAAFTEHPKVANGASELLEQVFGEAGRHARAAVGAPSLPLGAPVEVEFMFLVRDEPRR